MDETNTSSHAGKGSAEADSARSFPVILPPDIQPDGSRVAADPASGGTDSTAATGSVPSVGPRPISRRKLLAAAGVGAIGIAGAGGIGAVLGLEPGVRLSFQAAKPTPTPSAAPQRLVHRYRSRPDLTSPRVSVAAPAVGAGDGYIFLTPGGGPGPIIVDNTGEAIWIRAAESGKRAINLQPATYRGKPVLTWWEGTVTNAGVGYGEHVMVDASYSEIARIRAGRGLQADLHELLITPQDTALITAYAPRPSADANAAGHNGLLESVIQEIDIATGTLLWEWHSADHIAMSESYDPGSANVPFDYVHANSIEIDKDGNLLVSARHTWAVYKIDRETGQVLWRLGGKLSDFRMGSGASFAWQHDARRQPDGTITLFDDGTNGVQGPEKASRAIVLRVDERARTATLLRSYTHPAALLATSQGSMRVLPNGNVFVGWGSVPVSSEFASGGAVRFDAHCTPDAYSYRSIRERWMGQPSDVPAATYESGGDSTVAFVTWNGATNVATWLAVGGETPETMSPLASSPRRGFETPVVIPGQPSFLAIRALDGEGNVLAESAVGHP